MVYDTEEKGIVGYCLVPLGFFVWFDLLEVFWLYEFSIVIKLNRYLPLDFLWFFQRASAPSLATRMRSLAVIVVSRARPPRLPRSAAASERFCMSPFVMLSFYAKRIASSNKNSADLHHDLDQQIF